MPDYFVFLQGKGCVIECDKIFKSLNKLSSNTIIKKLQSSNTNDILEGINDIRLQGSPEHLPPLCLILRRSVQPDIKNAIIKLLDELKDQKATHQMIELIRSEKSVTVKRILVASCWKSGLDYSALLEPFFEIFVQDDFETAFEAYTIIDSNIYNSEAGIIKGCKHYLQNAWSNIPEDRLLLAQDLMMVMDSYM